MTPHLRGQVRAYVDGSLPPPLLHLYDKHLVCCAMCRHAADQERRIVAALRSDTGVPMSLRTSLIGLAATPPSAEPPARRAGPRIPVPPLGFRMPSGSPGHTYDPVPTVRPTAPPLHRSPMRAAVVASIAAGASVAAAWGLAVSPLPGARTTTARVPVASFGELGSGASTVGARAPFPAARTLSSTRVAGQPGSSDPVGSSLPSAPTAPSGSPLASVSSVTGGSSSGSNSSVAVGRSAAVPYWMVRARTSELVADVGRVRFSTARSAQSGP